MSSKMLIEVRSELEIDATVMTSKWSDIHLLMGVKKSKYLRATLDGELSWTSGGNISNKCLSHK